MLLVFYLPAQDNFYFPGEWEPHEAVWLGLWKSNTPLLPLNSEKRHRMSHRKILFDSVCNLCDAFVQVVPNNKS